MRSLAMVALLAAACAGEQTIVAAPGAVDTAVVEDSGVSIDLPPGEDSGPVTPDVPTVTCATDDDCVGKVQATLCTRPECTGGVCALGAGPKGAPCDDGDPCKTGKTCDSGLCTGGTDIPCSDGDPCTQDQCNPAGGCTHVAAAGPCDDGNPCTLADHCVDGTCTPGNSVCVCAVEADCAQWNDENACNGTISCIGGVCKVKPGSGVTCPIGEAGPCQVKGCDKLTGQCGVISVPDGTPCTDGNVCTAPDKCASGQCKGGTPACPCVDDAGCLAFDDGNLCNGLLRCTGGQCAPDPTSVVTCAGGGGPCAAGGCDPKSGKCSDEPVADGSPCDDGEACTEGDACKAGVCAGKAKTCDDKNPCTTDSCSPKGTCESTPNSLACDDGDPCTEGDVCASGTCKPGKDACACQKKADCLQFQPADKCAGTLACVGGKCVPEPGSAVICNPKDNTDCAASKCDPATGACQLKPTNDGAACLDADPCTTGEKCAQGLCTSGTAGCSCQAAGSLDCDISMPWASDAFGATDVIDAWPCAPGDYTGKEFTWSFKSSDPKAVTVSIDNDQGSSDVFVLADKGAGCSASACIKANVSTVKFVADPSKTYFVVVDGKKGSAGKFDLTVTCGDPAEIDCEDGKDNDNDGKTDCSDADCASDLACAGGEECTNQVDDDNDDLIDCEDPDCGADPVCTSACIASASAYCGYSQIWETGGFGATNSVSEYSCGFKQSFTGPEMVYAFKAGKSGLVTVALPESFGGASLFVLQEQGLGCNGTACVESGAGSVSFGATAGVTYYFVVDGANGAQGSYHITVGCE